MQAEAKKDIDSFLKFMEDKRFRSEPQNLYDSMNYIMELGGKRMRPMLLLLAYRAMRKKPDECALNLALAVEVFHNFSLVHDDIMDHASLRRGKPTVHEKWNESTAILAGDNLLIHCYKLIIESKPEQMETILSCFTEMAIQVCDGQQMDMNFPELDEVSVDDYLQMIKFKTAVLPAACLRIGALAAGANQEEANELAEFGICLGMAFQLMDDYLDCFGDSKTTGKIEGGDILEGKKTILYLHTAMQMNDTEKEILYQQYSGDEMQESEKVSYFREVFTNSGAVEMLMSLKSDYEKKALEHLDRLNVSEDIRSEFEALLSSLSSRRF